MIEKDPSHCHLYAPTGGCSKERDLCSCNLFSHSSSSSLSSFLPLLLLLLRLLNHHPSAEKKGEPQKIKIKEMGNCQAVDAAAMVIQHPNGKIERLYWPIPVSEVMKNNPGHYVSLIIPLQVTDDESSENESSRKESSEKDQGVPTEKKTVRYTRVKLLRPTDTLVLGHAYRLLTSQEVMKVLRAKKHAKMKKSEQESAERLHLNSDKQNAGDEHDISETSKTGLEAKEERQRARPAGNTAAGVGKSKSWRPALQSISEAGS